MEGGEGGGGDFGLGVGLNYIIIGWAMASSIKAKFELCLIWAKRFWRLDVIACQSGELKRAFIQLSQ